MKLRLFSLFFLMACVSASFSQPQAQGEYHRTIVRKTETERRKAKSKELFGAGVIMFANKDIPREGKTKEVEPMITGSFKSGDKFVGRVYLPRSVGKMDQNMPDAIIYRIYIDDGTTPFVTEVPREDMPDIDWSSWLLDFPDKFKEAMESMKGGPHKARVEIWSGYLVDPEELAELEKKAAAAAATKTTTTNKPAPNRPAAKPKLTGSKGRLWAVGEFKII
jgi:hypothetical protein